jgi:hypothetical protein
MKIFTAVAVAILLSSGMAYAQDNTGSGADSGQTSGADSDGTSYLTGPNINRFYTDESMGTMRPEADVKSAFQSMTPEEQANLKQACSGNKDNRWSALCNSIGGM